MRAIGVRVQSKQMESIHSLVFIEPLSVQHLGVMGDEQLYWPGLLGVYNVVVESTLVRMTENEVARITWNPYPDWLL